MIVLQVTEGGVTVAEANYRVNGGAGMVYWGRAVKGGCGGRRYFITRYPENYTPPDDPSAGTEIGSGSLGSLMWKLTGAGTLTISGSGGMTDFGGPSDTPWKDHMDKIMSIVIEDGVTNVGSSAFSGSAALSVTLPGSVTEIGSGAFNGTALVSLSVPGSVRTIGEHAFQNCANLVTISLSEGLETIGSGAFQACSKLASITLPASVRSVGDSAFFECTEMTEAAFRQNSSGEPVAMRENLFAKCWKLSKVTLPQSVDCIADNMFINCLSLTSLNIPQGATRIGGVGFCQMPAAFGLCSGQRDGDRYIRLPPATHVE